MSQLHDIDFSGLDGVQQNTTVMSYEERFPLSMWKLRSAVIDIPNIEKNIQQRIEKGVRA